MELTDYLSDAAGKFKLNFRFNKDSITDYLTKDSRKLKNYFSDNVPEEKRNALRKDLEKKVEDKLGEFHSELHGLARKTGTRGTMMYSIYNDIEPFISKTALGNVTPLAKILFAAKSVMELPAMYRYLTKSKDWYGALRHYSGKALNFFIPVYGGIMEASSFERMVKRGVIKEVIHDFIKEHGDYKTFEEIFREELDTPIKDAVEVKKEIKTEKLKEFSASTAA